MDLLNSNDEHSVLNALNKLGNLTAFKEFQVCLHDNQVLCFQLKYDKVNLH